MQKPSQSQVDAATALGNAVDAAVQRYILAPTPRNAAQLQRAIAVIYLTGVQQATSTLLALPNKAQIPAALAQLDIAVDMVATTMGFTKNTGREKPGEGGGRLVLPG